MPPRKQSPTEYFMCIQSISAYPQVPIDQDRFQRLKRARGILVSAFAIEEQYEIILGLYKSLEKTAFDISIEQITHHGMPDYEDFYALRTPLNVGMISLLTAVRLYLDTLAPNTRKCLPENSRAKSDVKKLRSAEYDAHPDYRFMEQLRNHTQHRGLPIHSMSMGGSWDETREHLEQKIGYVAYKERLKTDRKFKKQVLAEIGDEVDLQAATRQYVDCLSRIHLGVRKLAEQNVKDARQEVHSAISDYAATCKDGFIALYAFERRRGKVTDKVLLMLRWDDIRVQLQKKNPRPTFLRKMHITSKISKEKKK